MYVYFFQCWILKEKYYKENLEYEISFKILFEMLLIYMYVKREMFLFK